jgi:murein DD-endopeptidase MepM/ murein hydrolase activator NlpD
LKKLIDQLKKLDHSPLIIAIDKILEHRLFKPVAIVVITSFILFKGFEIGQNFLTDYQEYESQKRAIIPIKINISSKGINFDIDEDQVIEHRVMPGDTMLKILTDIGASEQDVFAILAAMKKIFDPRSIVTGNQVAINYKVKVGYATTKEGTTSVGREVIINSVEISPSLEEKIVVSRKNDGEYDARQVEVKLLRYVSRYSGTIKNGLFVDGVEAGISPTSMMNMINLYSYDVDFQRDIRSGDKFEMLVESFYSEDGKKVKDGNVLFSSLTLQNRSIDVYAYKINGNVEYFDFKGNSMRKSLLRTPVNGARVSSRFGMRRHPILGYSRMHKGTDFAAPRGTPILAAGSGTITYFGRKGGYGNYVQIRHNSDYSSAYGHASRFNRKFRVGSRVKQGDVVAYVGSTGRSTGPHLHFEVLFRGRQINPSKVKATSGIKLTGKELAKFEISRAEIEKYRKEIPNQVKQSK